MSSSSQRPDPPKVRRLSRPASMTVADVIEALSETVPFEYQGDTAQMFRGVATSTRVREVRRRFWVMRDRQWSRDRIDLYADSETTQVEDLATVLERGAEGVICTPDYKGHPLLEGRNVFFTPHTFDFTSRLIEVQHRLVRGRRTIAVTGTAGKTTVAAMIAHALRSLDKGKVQHNPHNRNFLHWALAYLTRAHRFGHTVLEVSGGALSYEQNEYAMSADVSVVTSIAEAHLDIHGDLEGVARDKSNIFKNPPRDAAAVINVDAPYSDLLIARAEAEGTARIITYGESPGADIRLVGYDYDTGRVRANVVGLDVEYALGAKGTHVALNSLAVLATIRDLGLDWAAGLVSLESFVQPKGRNGEAQIPLSTGGYFTLVDGSFNANPASVRASLQSMAATKSQGRKVAVLGDILELGDHAEEIHHSLASDIRAAGSDSLHLLGENFHKVHDVHPDLASEVHLWHDVDELIESFPGTLQGGDLVLLKASGGMGLKQLATVFLDRVGDDEEPQT